MNDEALPPIFALPTTPSDESPMPRDEEESPAEQPSGGNIATVCWGGAYAWLVFRCAAPPVLDEDSQLVGRDSSDTLVAVLTPPPVELWDETLQTDSGAIVKLLDSFDHMNVACAYLREDNQGSIVFCMARVENDQVTLGHGVPYPIYQAIAGDSCFAATLRALVALATTTWGEAWSESLVVPPSSLEG